MNNPFSNANNPSLQQQGWRSKIVAAQNEGKSNRDKLTEAIEKGQWIFPGDNKIFCLNDLFVLLERIPEDRRKVLAPVVRTEDGFLTIGGITTDGDRPEHHLEDQPVITLAD